MYKIAGHHETLGIGKMPSTRIATELRVCFRDKLKNVDLTVGADDVQEADPSFLPALTVPNPPVPARQVSALYLTKINRTPECEPRPKTPNGAHYPASQSVPVPCQWQMVPGHGTPEGTKEGTNTKGRAI